MPNPALEGDPINHNPAFCCRFGLQTLLGSFPCFDSLGGKSPGGTDERVFLDMLGFILSN